MQPRGGGVPLAETGTSKATVAGCSGRQTFPTETDPVTEGKSAILYLSRSDEDSEHSCL